MPHSQLILIAVMNQYQLRATLHNHIFSNHECNNFSPANVEVHDPQGLELQLSNSAVGSSSQQVETPFGNKIFTLLAPS